MRRMFALVALSASAYISPVYTFAYNANAYAAELVCFPVASGLERMEQIAERNQGKWRVLNDEETAAFLGALKLKGDGVLLVEGPNGMAAAVLDVMMRNLCGVIGEQDELDAAMKAAGGVRV